MKKPRVLLKSMALAVVLVLLSVWPSSAFAAAAGELSYGWPKSGNPTTINLLSYTYNSVWLGPMLNGQVQWNNSSARVAFICNSTSSNTVTAASYADDWYGINTGTASGSTLTKFVIKLNSRTISRDATNISNFITSSMAHELGHAIWLADNPSTGTPNSSLMNHNRDRSTLIGPTSSDIARVNNHY